MKTIAAQIAQETRLLCLDEFHVTDIGDAMLMRGLLEGLFERGVALVTTSNEHPDELYARGLQRAQFLPAIELIKRHMEVVQLDGGNDYRLRALTRAGVYHHPLGAAADAALENGFICVAGEAGEAAAELEIEGRTLIARRLAPGTVWFDFAQLCEGPRGTADYIELARRYHTVLLSGVPQFRPQQSDAMRRFTWLIDEFYDRQVKLMLSARSCGRALVRVVGAPADTQRTRSRLIEMQSTQYLRLPHLGLIAATDRAAALYRRRQQLQQREKRPWRNSRHTASSTRTARCRRARWRSSLDELDPGEVVIKAAYSSVNYKDALAATGAGKIIRRFPCIGGIDVSGTVESSTDARFKAGDQVICTSYDFGVAHDGGYAEYVRVPADWVVPLPQWSDLVRSDGARHRRLHRGLGGRAHGAGRAHAGERAGDRHRRNRRRRQRRRSIFWRAPAITSSRSPARKPRRTI